MAHAFTTSTDQATRESDLMYNYDPLVAFNIIVLIRLYSPEQTIRVPAHPWLQDPGVRRRRHGRMGVAVPGQRRAGLRVPVSPMRYPAPRHGQRSSPGVEVGARIHGRRGTPQHPQGRHWCRGNTTGQVRFLLFILLPFEATFRVRMCVWGGEGPSTI